MLIDSQRRLYEINSEVSGFSGILYRADHCEDDEVLTPYANAHFADVLHGDTFAMSVALKQARMDHMIRKRNAMVRYVKDLHVALRLIGMTTTYTGRKEFQLNVLKNCFADEAAKAETSARTIEHIRTRDSKYKNANMRSLEKELKDVKKVKLKAFYGDVVNVDTALFIQGENVLNSRLHIANLNMIGGEQNAGYVGARWCVKQPLGTKQRETLLFAAKESEQSARLDIKDSANILTNLRDYVQSERPCHLH